MNRFLNVSTEPVTTTQKPPEHNDAKFLIVPLVVIILITLLAILVYLMAKRRRMNKLKRTILQLYEFDSNEQEWEPLTASNEFPYYSEYVTSNV